MQAKLLTGSIYKDITYKLNRITAVKEYFIPNKKNNYKPYLLRKGALVIYTLIIFFVNTFGGLLGLPQAMASSITAENIIRLTNQERAAAGLNTLNTNAKLTAAAQAKANNMFEVQYWDHYGPNGETPWMFITQAGYTYVYAGENLAKGFRTAEGVHEAWMASPTHKENIMSPNYKDIGVAVMEGVLLGKETILVVQMFGNQTTETFKPVSPAPKPSSTTTKPTPKPVIPEKGEIKSIRIVNPKNGDLINDANVDIKGDTQNVSGEYSVEIHNNGEFVGETKATQSEWAFDKGSDWPEGEQNISAKLKGEDVVSETVKFIIDSTPPQVNKETIKVQNGGSMFTLTFEAPQDAVDIQFVSSGKTHQIQKIEGSNTVSLDILKSDIGDSSKLVMSDQAGNIAEVDISEYFLEEVQGEKDKATVAMSIKNIFGTTDGISLIVVSFVLILLILEAYISWKKGKLGKNAGDLFTIGAWWLILLVGIFNGFGGVIS